MGMIQSYIFSTNTVAASLFFIIIAVIWSNQSSRKPSKRQNRDAKLLVNKGPKKTAESTGVTSKQAKDEFKPEFASFEESLPGALPITALDQSTLSSSGSLKKEKKKRNKRSRTPIPSDNQSAGVNPVAGPSRSPTVSADESNRKTNTEEAWTRVESRSKTSSHNVATSDAGLTTATSVDDDTSSVGGGLDKSVDEVNRPKPKTLAEKLLPKGRKTEVDDILETPHYPELSRVMRITSPQEQPAAGYTWADYEDADDVRGMDADGEDDGEWDVVVTKSRGKAKHSRPAPIDKAVETKTKKQRQHQARREAEKSAKDDGERERLEALRKHQRERENALLEEQLKKKGKKPPVLSGGMKATVDARGNLVWEDA